MFTDVVLMESGRHLDATLARDWYIACKGAVTRPGPTTLGCTITGRLICFEVWTRSNLRLDMPIDFIQSYGQLLKRNSRRRGDGPNWWKRIPQIQMPRNRLQDSRTQASMSRSDGILIPDVFDTTPEALGGATTNSTLTAKDASVDCLAKNIRAKLTRNGSIDNAGGRSGESGADADGKPKYQ